LGGSLLEFFERSQISTSTVIDRVLHMPQISGSHCTKLSNSNAIVLLIKQ
jgi:hypothetical protein